MLRIRPAVAADIPLIQEIERKCATAAHWGQAQYDRLLQDRTQRATMVAEQDQRICGFLIVRRVLDEYEIENIAVRPDIRRRGLGTALLANVLEGLRQEGGREVFLEVRESNFAARRLYEKFGFREVGRRPGYYSDPAEDGILYRFTLGHPSRTIEPEQPLW